MYTCVTFSVRGANLQIWNNLRGDFHVLSTLFTDKRYPRRPSRTRRISRLVSPPNGGNRYGVRLTAYYKVSLIINLNYVLLCINNEYKYILFTGCEVRMREVFLIRTEAAGK